MAWWSKRVICVVVIESEVANNCVAFVVQETDSAAQRFWGGGVLHSTHILRLSLSCTNSGGFGAQIYICSSFFTLPLQVLALVCKTR